MKEFVLQSTGNEIRFFFFSINVSLQKKLLMFIKIKDKLFEILIHAHDKVF